GLSRCRTQNRTAARGGCRTCALCPVAGRAARHTRLRRAQREPLRGTPHRARRHSRRATGKSARACREASARHRPRPAGIDMKQHLFEQRHAAEWLRFETLLAALERGKAEHHDCACFAADYRRLCQHLALAQERGYSSHLNDRLQQLAMRGHQQLYRHRSHLGSRIIGFALAGFPRLVRREWRAVLTGSLLFFGSLIGMGLLAWLFPELIYSLIAPE